MGRVAGFFLHFYQPPRENPWLGLVPSELSAWPYHDWNERIADECYRAMVAVALPRDDGGVELFEPLANSTYDVAPTLHRWLEHAAPEVDRAIDFQSHHVASAPTTVAFAAPLCHAILPLARACDKDRLVAWGIADYVARFGVAPTGMWLPETAVDASTLDTLARHGIRYTVLMPGQAQRVRPLAGQWHDVDTTTLDTSRSYRVELEEGRSMTVAFAHGDLSQRVAFEGLMDDGTALGDTMMRALHDRSDGAVLLIADGETYGHHHRFGDVGLAWALRHVQRDYDTSTSLGDWLSDHDPEWEVALRPVSAWSCAHGVERWRSDCGCTTSSRDGWNQRWRSTLRTSLDWLRDVLGSAADEELARLVHSPDEAMLDYGAVIAGVCDPIDFVRRHARGDVDDATLVQVLSMCEIHLNLQYSFTSCAWFFADPAAIETAIALRYAAVAIDLAGTSLGVDVCEEFVNSLRPMTSNEFDIDGAEIWRRATEPHRYDHARVAAGFAAQYATDAPSARADRGVWSIEVEDDRSPGSLDVLLRVTHGPTHRVQHFEVRVEPSATWCGDVLVRGMNGTETRYAFSDLGADVIAHVATSRLIAPGSEDYGSALDAFAVEVLVRGANPQDAVVLESLATSMRCVDAHAESAIRRGLLALAGRANGVLHDGRISALAHCVGLEDPFAATGTSTPAD